MGFNASGLNAAFVLAFFLVLKFVALLAIPPI